MTNRPAQDAASWTSTPPPATAPAAAVLAAHPALWLSAPAVAAAAEIEVGEAAAQLSVLAAVGHADTELTRYRATARSSPTLADPAVVAGLAGWYLAGADQALATVGSAPAYWPVIEPAVACAPSFVDVEAAHAWLVAEETTLLGVIASATYAGLHEVIWRLASALLQSYSYRGSYERWEEIARIGVNAAEAAGDPAARAQALALRARGYSQRGLTRAAAALQHQALEIREDAGDRRGLAYSHNAIGMIAHRDGDLGGAIGHYRACIQLAEKAGDEFIGALARHNLGGALRTQGQLGEAREQLETAEAYYRAHGHHPYLASIAQINADILGLGGQTGDAVTAAERALALAGRSPDRAVLAWTYRTYAVALGRAGRHADAVEAARASAALYGAVDDSQRWAEALEVAAVCCAANDEAEQARVLRVEADQARAKLAAADPDEAADPAS